MYIALVLCFFLLLSVKNFIISQELYFLYLFYGALNTLTRSLVGITKLS